MLSNKYEEILPGFTPANNLITFLAGEPVGGAGAAGQPDRRAALRHGQAILGARAGRGMTKKQRRICNNTAYRLTLIQLRGGLVECFY